MRLSDAEEYTCLFFLNTTHPYIEKNSTQTSSVTNITILNVSITVSTSFEVILDVVPYNNVTLNCTIIYQPSDLVIKVNDINWFQIYTNQSQQLSNDKNSSIIILNVNESGIAEYQCMTNFILHNQTSPSNNYTNNITVTVKGPNHPLQPTHISTGSITNTSVNISWTIESVTYTPETYTVHYWAMKCDNNNMYNITDSSSYILDEFVRETNTSYITTLHDLLPFINYTYYISSSNTIGKNDSHEITFTTNQSIPSGPPKGLINTSITAYSISFNWSPPSDCSRNGIITHYSLYCSYYNATHPHLQQSIVNDTIIGTQHTLDNLLPFTNYTCQLTSSTSVGEGPNTTSIVVLTSEAAPATPPTMLNISAHNSTALNLSWSKPIQPNGIITHYSINCSNETVSSRYITNSTSETELISGLLPYTNYTCSVSGYTIVGRGPEDSIIGLTDQSTPEAVTSLMYNVINDTAVSVSWNKPSRPNGIIKDYEVMAFVESEIQYVSNITNNSIIPLEPHTPYFISVAGYTIKGRGDVSNTSIFFTRETIPMFGPQNISASWINRTAIVIRWKPLTLVEARGFLTRYTITAQPLSTSTVRVRIGRRQEVETLKLTHMALPNDTSIVISSGALNAKFDYMVIVTSSTKIGESVDNLNFTLLAFDDSDFLIIVSSGGVGVLILLCVVITVCILCIRCCYRRMKGKVKQKNFPPMEMYTSYITVIKDNENDCDIIETMYQSKGVVSTAQNILINEFFKFVATSQDKLKFEFEEIKAISPVKPSTIAEENDDKNRFNNILPFDDNIVSLPLVDCENGTDYINASYVNGYKRKNAYIATQGPLPSTAPDFWRMMLEYKLPTIVMLTQLVEGGITKCYGYWPDKVDTTKSFDYDIDVTLVSEKHMNEFVIRKLALKKDTFSFNVTQYHFTEWPDHGAPSDKIIMISLIQRIREVHPPDGPPLVVHCSAGVGRTGTFIVLDTMLQRMEKEDTLNICDHILHIRQQRTKLVQAEAQYIYIHEALAEYIRCGKTFFPITSSYQVIEELKAIVGEGESRKSGFKKQFELLKEMSDNTTTISCSDAEENIERNRFTYNLPYNHNRVKVINTKNFEGYINASWIDGWKEGLVFIATEVPKKEFTEDFWKMIRQQEIKTIISLHTFNDEEVGESDLFWPNDVSESITYGDVTVMLESESQQSDYTNQFIELTIKGEKEKHNVTMYTIDEWDDGLNIPRSKTSVLSMLEDINVNQRQTGNKPVTVVCKDGVGRSGTLITIYAQLERVKTEGVADIFQFIKKARSQRAGLVQQIEQYIFCHEVLGEYAEEMSTYDNFKHVV
jgi:netrin-G3 ligand